MTLCNFSPYPQGSIPFASYIEPIKALGLPGLIASYPIGPGALGISFTLPLEFLFVVQDLQSIEVDYLDRFLELGYIKYHVSRPSVVIFHRKSQDPSALDCFLHFYEEGHPQIARRLLFASYLQSHHLLKDQYASLQPVITLRESQSPTLMSFIKHVDRLALEQHLGPLPHFQIRPQQVSRPLTKEQIIQALANNVYFEMTYYTYYSSNCELLEEGNVHAVVCPLKSTLFNYIVRSNINLEHVDECIRSTLEIHKSRNLPFSWWVGPLDTPIDLPLHLSHHNIHFEEAGVGMFCNLHELTFPLITNPMDLEIRHVRTLKELREFDSVHVESGADPLSFEMVYGETPLRFLDKDSPSQSYVGYLYDRPIVTGTLIFHAGVAGIYYVGTVPDQRRRGFATIMMQHLLKEAYLHGYRYATLVASDMGRAIYEKLGFQSICAFDEYGSAGSV